MLKWYIKIKERLSARVNNEQGAVSMEWIMIGLMAVAVVAAIISALENADGTSLANAILKKLAEFVGKIG